MRNSAIVLSGAQTDSCNVQGGLLLGNAAPAVRRGSTVNF